MFDNIIQQLDKLVDRLIAFRKEQRDQADSALRAISVALDETYLYYQRMEHGGARNSETEQQLVKYWSAAAIPMRHVDPDLAQTCDLKSEYWLNPDSWSPPKVYTKGIGLA